MSKQTAEIIIRHLLGIVAALRKEYGIPMHSQEITIADSDNIASSGIIPIKE
jgi:hypothetical protein